ERPHPARRLDLVHDRLQDEPNSVAVTGVDVGQLVYVVAATALPLEPIEGDVVMDAEVLERREQALVERLPQPQLDGSAAVEPGPYIRTVCALWRCGES